MAGPSGPARSPTRSARSPSIPQVRQRLVAMQREIIAEAWRPGAGIVAEGRDIGTVVAPDAPVKVFLTASEAVRASRRSADLAADPAATVAVTRREQARRDRRDAPQMARAADAVEIDTTALDLDEVIGEIVALATAGRRARGPRDSRAGHDGEPEAAGRAGGRAGPGRGRPAQRRQVHAGEPDPRQPAGGRGGHPRCHQGPGRLRRHLARPGVHPGRHRRLGARGGGIAGAGRPGGRAGPGRGGRGRRGAVRGRRRGGRDRRRRGGRRGAAPDAQAGRPGRQQGRRRPGRAGGALALVARASASRCR